MQSVSAAAAATHNDRCAADPLAQPLPAAPDRAPMQSNGLFRPSSGRGSSNGAGTSAAAGASKRRRNNVFAPLLCCFGNQPSARATVASGQSPTARPTSATVAAVPATAVLQLPVANHETTVREDSDISCPQSDVNSIITQVSRPLDNSTTSSSAKTIAQPPSRDEGDCAVTLEKGLAVKCSVSGGGAAVRCSSTEQHVGRTASSIVQRGSGSVGAGEPNHNCSQTPSKYLLPSMPQAGDVGRKCLVIDLDETLVHSSFKPVQNADFVVPVEIDGTIHQVYVLKRPHVDEFLQRMGQLYECVLFTASLAKYADPVANLLDKWGVFRARLFRESCVFHRGSYVKDLGRLGRDLSQVIIIDNSPASYIFHPDNAVPVNSWFDDMEDNELLELCPFFENLSRVDSVYTVLRGGGGSGGSSVSMGSTPP